MGEIIGGMAVIAAAQLNTGGRLVITYEAHKTTEAYSVRRVQDDGYLGHGIYRDELAGAQELFASELSQAWGVVVGPKDCAVVRPGDREIIGAKMRAYSDAADEWDAAVSGESDEDPEEKAREMRAEADDLHNALISISR